MTRRDRRYNATTRRGLDFFWDGDDHLRLVKQGATNRLTASYNGAGLRVNRWDAYTGTHDYTWGVSGIVHDSLNDTRYTPGFAHRKGSVDRSYHSDWLGSTR
jgi:hypothetical protein